MEMKILIQFPRTIEKKDRLLNVDQTSRESTESELCKLLLSLFILNDNCAISYRRYKIITNYS